MQLDLAQTELPSVLDVVLARREGHQAKRRRWTVRVADFPPASLTTFSQILLAAMQ
jgi:hypothetical protein